MSSSRIPAFYRLTVDERRQKLAEALGLSPDDRAVLEAADALPLDVADIMVENAVGTFALPFGVGLNFQVNGRDIVIPMVVEEPSVIAAASNAALVARVDGGFVAEADPGAMIGQIQLVQVPDPGAAIERLLAARERILARAEALTPGLCRRGAGPRDIEVRLVRSPRDETMVVFHVIVDTGDAMGANAVNTAVERLAPRIERITGGRVLLRILSNLADRRLACSAVRIVIARPRRDGE
jgi:hydroxymethylglutaryl-CoA reductase